MNKKAIFLDIDGTIKPFGSMISPELKEAVRKAVNNGHYVFINTGRSDKDIPAELSEVPFSGFVYSAGGKITVGDELIKDVLLEPELFDRIIRFMARNNIPFTIDAIKENYSNREMEIESSAPDLEGASSELKKAFDSGSGVKPYLPLSAYTGEPVYKINFIIHNDHPELGDELEKTFGDETNIVSHGNLLPGFPLIFGEIGPNSVDKGKAILDVCEYLGLDPKDTIAFGDSMNDAEMLLAAGQSVAMGNSLEEVKEMADIVCEDAEEDGVVKQLQRFGIIEA